MFNFNNLIMKTVCGLDVHKDTIFVCTLNEQGASVLGEFTTMTPDLNRLRDYLKEQCVEQVAMESTGIYWIPIWRVLEERSDFELILVNPYFIKQVPGRKTDVKDSQWIAMLLMKGLLRGSYIPDRRIRELREYGRKAVKLCGQLNRIEMEIDRQLSKCNIRITSLASTINSQTVMKVVQAIIGGETRSEVLETMVHGRIRNKYKEQVRASLTGTIAPYDILLLRQSYQAHNLFLDQQEELNQAMLAICEADFQQELALLCSMPGIKKIAAMQIIAEVGFSVKAFITAAALCGWAGLRPRNDESAGKIKSKKILHGNKYIRRILVQCAWASSRTKGSWFKWKFDELSKRMTSKKALIAIARKMLVVVWCILETGVPYQPRPIIPDENKRNRQIQYHRKQLEALLT
jgi:transposase